MISRLPHYRIALAVARTLTIAVVAAFVAAPLPARAESSAEIGRKAFDLVVLRPLGFVQTAVSGVFFVVALPVAAMTDTTDELVEICWTQPVDQTFRRPLGEL